MKLVSFLGFLLSLICLALSDAFSPTHSRKLASTLWSASSVQQDQNLKPKYEVEPLPIRIGHGFDIHKMVPLKDAGQPIVIAGVVIDHKDLKVHLYSSR
jgi:hypothetical protein